MIGAAFDEADRRDPHHTRQKIFLVDGNKQQITAIGDHAAARQWADEQLLRILHGRAKAVAATLRSVTAKTRNNPRTRLRSHPLLEEWLFVQQRRPAKYSNQRARDREPIFFPREPYWVPSPERTGHLARGLETDWNTALTAAETDLVRRLAVHHPDAIIAGILNRQGRCTPEDCPTPSVGSKDLRHYWKINFHQSDDQPHEGPVLTIADAATELGITASTLHRWINDGFIASEQIIPSAP